MFCQNCGIEAPTKQVTFHQNIGLLVMRFSRTAEGSFCKSCVHKTFWTYQAVNLFLGPWGVISFVVTPIFLIMNLVQYIGALGMPSVPPGAAEPSLTPDEITRLNPYAEQLIQRVGQNNEPFDAVVQDVSMRTNTTPGQVALYIHLLFEQAKSQQQ